MQINVICGNRRIKAEGENADCIFDFWNTTIATKPWYDPAKEHCAVLIHNTKRFIIGWSLVSIGGLHEATCHPREVFRPVIALGG